MPIPLGILAVAGAGAAGGGSFDLLETTVLAGTATSVVFSNINNYAADYDHLQVRWVTRSAAANTSLAGAILYINGDTGTTHAYHTLNGNGSTVTSGAGTATSITLLDSVAGANATDQYVAGITDILDFSNTNKNKTLRSIYGCPATGESDIFLHSGLWINTAAITSIEFYSANVYNTGSRFSLYGIK